MEAPLPSTSDKKRENGNDLKGLRRFYSSNRRLFVTLEGGEKDKVSPVSMSKILHEVEKRLSEGIAYYKPQSKESRSALEKGNFTAHGKTVASLDTKLKEFVLKVSDTLNLDEIQSYELLQSFLSTQYRRTKKSFRYSDATLQEVLYDLSILHTL